MDPLGPRVQPSTDHVPASSGAREAPRPAVAVAAGVSRRTLAEMSGLGDWLALLDMHIL